MWYPGLVEPRFGAPKGQPVARGRSLTEFQKEFPDEAICAAFLFNPCLSGCHPHPLNVGCAHSPEYSPPKVGAAAPPAIPSSERNEVNG